MTAASNFEPVGTKKFYFDIANYSCSAAEARVAMSRTVAKSILSRWQDEGVGARVRRSVGRYEVGPYLP